MASNLKAGLSVELSTFKKYGKGAVIGCKTEEKNGKTLVTSIWCKLCAKHKTAILSNSLCKGSARTAVETYIKGTNHISKWNIDRHLTGKGHKLAMEEEMCLPQEERIPINESAGGQKRLLFQPRIDTKLKESTSEAYLKMIKTAYQLAITPTMPMKHFSVLVKCQRENGVVLIDGRDNNKAAREYIHTIADAIREKCAAVIASQHFMSLMSDGSQARKTGSEKELVMIRIERNGIPCYLVVSLLEMSEYGGVDADSIKGAIDSIFLRENGYIKMTQEVYTNKMVSATADGASVNTGKYNGVLTQLSENRDWLLTIHCANHRVELAFKSAITSSSFNACDEFYKSIYYLLKNSGKLSDSVHSACKALGIDGHKKIPKIHGTRFVSHRRKGMSILLDIWPGLITAFENSSADRKGKEETKAKIRGLLGKLKSFEFFCKVASYADILDAAGPASLVFEGDGVMPYEIIETIERTCIELDDLEESAGTDEELLSSHIARFTYDNDTYQVHGVYRKEGHGRKKAADRENVKVEISGMVYSDRARQIAATAKKTTAIHLKDMLRKRFPENDSEIYKSMRIYDPQYWSEESDYGVAQLRILFGKFKIPLIDAGINEKDLFLEWKRFKGFAKRQMAEFFHEPKVLWQKILTFRRLEFPNLCLMIELLTCIAGSNSAVERAFSTLTLLLSDCRLSMKHDTIEDLMLIKGNDKVWTPTERKDILSRAVEIYLEKKRKARCVVQQEEEPMEKRPSTSSGLSQSLDDIVSSSSSSAESQSEDTDESESEFEI